MLKRIVESRGFELTSHAIVVASLITFSMETLPDLGARSRQWLSLLEVIAIALFTVEYALRIVAAENRLRFVFSFYGLIDLIAILPFYLSLSVDLLAIRALRLLRVFRILKLLRYTRAMERLRSAFDEVKEELVLFLFTALLVVFLSSAGIYYFEHQVQPQAFGSIFHCMWWAIVTLTTVGYGDVYPITLGGRIFTTFVLLSGVGIVAVPAALLSSALTKARQDERARQVPSLVQTPGPSGRARRRRFKTR
jgi:voltage-gated potassium channel